MGAMLVFCEQWVAGSEQCTGLFAFVSNSECICDGESVQSATSSFACGAVYNNGD